VNGLRIRAGNYRTHYLLFATIMAARVEPFLLIVSLLLSQKCFLATIHI
jgi:hypothetical protein